MTREEQIDWLCRLRADLNNGVIFTPWNKEFTEALNDALEQEPTSKNDLGVDCVARQDVERYIEGFINEKRGAMGTISNLSNNLLPCPFCGGRPFLEKSMRCFINGKTDKAVLVRCLDCGARAGRVRLSDYGKTSHSKEAEEVAANMWNSRPAPQN